MFTTFQCTLRRLERNDKTGEKILRELLRERSVKFSSKRFYSRARNLVENVVLQMGRLLIAYATLRLLCDCGQLISQVQLVMLSKMTLLPRLSSHEIKFRFNNIAKWMMHGSLKQIKNNSFWSCLMERERPDLIKSAKSHFSHILVIRYYNSPPRWPTPTVLHRQ